MIFTGTKQIFVVLLVGLIVDLIQDVGAPLIYFNGRVVELEPFYTVIDAEQDRFRVTPTGTPEADPEPVEEVVNPTADPYAYINPFDYIPTGSYGVVNENVAPVQNAVQNEEQNEEDNPEELVPEVIDPPKKHWYSRRK